MERERDALAGGKGPDGSQLHERGTRPSMLLCLGAGEFSPVSWGWMLSPGTWRLRLGAALRPDL